MKRLLNLLILIARNGTLRHSGFDFTIARTEALRGIITTEHSVKSRARRIVMKNPYLRRMVTEIAYLKACVGLRGGHLSIAEKGLLYIRIPKAASTSISKAILQSNYPNLKSLNLSPSQINYLADVHLETGLKETAASPLVFAIVRNPYERIVSVYREFFEFSNGPFIYQDYLFGFLRKEFSFRQFVESVKMIPDTFKDQHFRPQHHFLRYYERQNLQVKVMALNEPHEIALFLQKYDLPFEHIKRGITPYDYREYYDRECLEVVNAIYDVDIRRFGYRQIGEEIQFSIEHRDVHI